jgi:hypothetical protein
MENIGENRYFAIFSVNEIDKIDFSQLTQLSTESLRKNLNKTKTFVEWYGNEPEFISTLTTLDGIYNYQEILKILNNEEWLNYVHTPFSFSI